VRRLLALVGLLLVVAAPATLAATPRFTQDEIETEVMCPICGTRLDLSHAPAANQIRDFIDEKREAGWTKQQVKDALVAQFGQRILATTPTEGSGLFAWLVPLAVGAGGIAVAAGLVLVWRRRPRADPAPATATLDDESRRRVDDALRDFD
jgi:cytochrome c-type biogenesis protein CcmH